MSPEHFHPPDARAAAAKRLAVLDAYLRAHEHREAVMTALGRATDPDDARRAIESLLSITPVQASAVLELRLRYWTEAEAEKTRGELAAIVDSFGDSRTP